MNQPEIIAALKDVIKTFEESGIEYYIGGSVASSAYGIGRSTNDIDIISHISVYNIKTLVEKLKGKYFIDENMILDAIKTNTSFNIIQYETATKIDIFILKNNSYDLTAFERKKEDILLDENNELKIFLCSPEDTILSKLNWYVLGGKISERQWLDILGVIKVQMALLDKRYLQHWAIQLGVDDLLDKAFEEAEG